MEYHPLFKVIFGLSVALCTHSILLRFKKMRKLRKCKNLFSLIQSKCIIKKITMQMSPKTLWFESKTY